MLNDIAANHLIFFSPPENFSGDRLQQVYDPRHIPDWLLTKRMALKRLIRIKKDAKVKGFLTLTHDTPIGARFGRDPITEDWLKPMREGLRLVGGLSEVDDFFKADLYARGQLTESKLYHVNDTYTITAFTSEVEAQDYLSMLLFDGSHTDDYIVKDPQTGQRATWKKKRSRPDIGKHLRGEHFYGPKRGMNTAFVSLDSDRHEAEVGGRKVAKVPAAVHQRRAEVVNKVLPDQFPEIIWRPEINDANGSFKQFGYLGRWVARDEAMLICSEIREALTTASPEDADYWAKIELYPDNCPQVFCPLHPKKITIGPNGKISKIKRHRFIKDANGKKYRRNFRAYSCVEYVNGIISGQQFDKAAFATALSEACKNCPDITPEELLELQAEKKTGKVAKLVSTKKTKKPKGVRGNGSIGSLKGRFVSVLLDFFHDDTMPEDDTLNPIMGCYLRLACYQDDDMEYAVSFFMEHLRHRKNRHFSDRLMSEEYDKIEKVLRATAKAVWNGNRYQDDPQLSHQKLTAVADYLKEIGFRITQPETWQNYKGQKGCSPGPRMIWTSRLQGLALELAQIMVADLDTTKKATESIISFVHVRGELALSMLAKLVEAHGVKCGHVGKRKAIKDFLIKHNLIILHKRHYHDKATGYRHGTFYFAGSEVRFENDTVAVGRHTTPHTTLSIISFQSEEEDSYWEEELILEGRRQRCDRLWKERWLEIVGKIRQAA